MHELLGEGAVTAGNAVRVVRADAVAALRRSSPDSAIVALVRSTEPAEAITARLAGADVVLPCCGDAAPDPADLATAEAAARVLAGRARVVRDETRAAAHEFAGHASAVGLVAEVLGPQEPPQRAGQLRGLAARGAVSAWRAGRLGRSSGGSIELVDLLAVVAATCRDDRPRRPLTLQIEGRAGNLVLVDRIRLVSAIGRLIDNARRSGATRATVRVASTDTDTDTDAADADAHIDADGGNRDDGGAAWSTVTVIDDGRGLPAGRPPAELLTPFVTGWPEPGDGLGLAEVAEFAADHGGDLTIAPRADAPGARVTLRLPAVRAPARQPASAQAHRPDPEHPDRALADVLEGIARRDPLARSLEALVATMERQLPGSSCSILLLDHESATLRHAAGARLPAPYRAAIDGLRIGPYAGSCGTAAFHRQEVIVADIATDERWFDYRALALGFGLRSCWSRPILDVDRDVVLGTFAVYHGEPWVPGPAATELVQRLTHVAAVAIGTAALHGRLVESEARFRSTFEAAGLGIALVGPTGIIQDANAALAAMAGRPVTGESFPGLLVDPDAAATGRALGALLARPGDRHLPAAEVRVRRPTGEPVWAAMSGTLIRGPGGEPRHFCIELFDLTERRRVAQARREQAVAQAADRAKSELLAQVSHEVRTPLNAVIGFAQLLAAGQLPADRQRAALEHILGAGRHLQRVVNDLLDLTGAEAGRLQLVLESVESADLIAEATRMLAGLAAEHGIALRVDAALGGSLWADRQRVRQILLNLIGNAIKFTPTGGAVDAVCLPDAILVRDNGCGIPADQIPLLFTPFHRADYSVEGSGLGLTVSRRLARAMDGDLVLDATSAAGSTFRLTLPAAPVSSRPRSPAAP